MSSDYDNIFLVPKGISNIAHRGDVDLSCPELDGLYPIVSSPMKGISGSSLVIEMGKLNCLGILHRFDTYEKRIENISKISEAKVPFGIAIGINDFDKEIIVAETATNNGCNYILVDVANGYLPQFKDVGKQLRNKFGDSINLIAGNVITYDGAEYLINCGFNWVRVGIGNGIQCTTRTTTAIGRNQLVSLSQCSFSDINLISDGGIDTSGKAVLSFHFGATAVMLGSILGHSIEAENDGVIFGMASRRNHIENNKEIKSIEGKETVIDNSKKRPLKEIINEFFYGIRSACTYGNCTKYTDIQNNFTWEANNVL